MFLVNSLRTELVAVTAALMNRGLITEQEIAHARSQIVQATNEEVAAFTQYIQRKMAQRAQSLPAQQQGGPDPRRSPS
jgi:hypothetical protein